MTKPPPDLLATMDMLEGLLEKATPGPWQDKYGPDAPRAWLKEIVGAVDGDADDCGRLHMTYESVCEMADTENDVDNLDFIITARNTLPDLLAEVRALVERNAALETELAEARAALSECRTAAMEKFPSANEKELRGHAVRCNNRVADIVNCALADKEEPKT